MEQPNERFQFFIDYQRFGHQSLEPSDPMQVLSKGFGIDFGK